MEHDFKSEQILTNTELLKLWMYVPRHLNLTTRHTLNSINGQALNGSIPTVCVMWK